MRLLLLRTSSIVLPMPLVCTMDKPRIVQLSPAMGPPHPTVLQSRIIGLAVPPSILIKITALSPIASVLELAPGCV